MDAPSVLNDQPLLHRLRAAASQSCVSRWLCGYIDMVLAGRLDEFPIEIVMPYPIVDGPTLVATIDRRRIGFPSIAFCLLQLDVASAAPAAPAAVPAADPVPCPANAKATSAQSALLQRFLEQLPHPCHFGFILDSHVPEISLRYSPLGPVVDMPCVMRQLAQSRPSWIDEVLWRPVWFFPSAFLFVFSIIFNGLFYYLLV
jgi:hypothetical protein